MSYERPYYEGLGYRPFLFYIVFGVKDGHLQVSRERHHVDALPDGLELIFCKKPDNSAYMEDLLGGALGRVLEEKNHSLYEAVCKTDRWAILQGEVQQDADLHYMRNAIGFVQALAENGAVGILDLQTFGFFSPKAWTDTVFLKTFAPHTHIVLLTSETKDGCVWLHTRGLRKFGRPDISMEKVPKTELEHAVQLVNQMAYYGALGVFFTKPAKLHTQAGRTYLVKPDFVNDFENTDFNNAYYRIIWDACERLE